MLRFARDCTQPYFNKAAAVVRAVVERPFALMKGPYDVARRRDLGLERNGTHPQLVASAYDLKTAMVLTRCGGFNCWACPINGKWG